MTARPRTLALSLAAAAVVLGGCSNPDARPTGRTVAADAGISSPGEPGAPAPPPSSTYQLTDPSPTPTAALAAFASLYVNWSYRDLAGEQRALAAISLGAARAAELQAAATSAADSTLARARIANHGTVVSIAADREQRGAWVLVTREQTSGGGDYEALASAYHVTVARVARVAGGYAVSEWLPQR
jgi:hypothetical protein